MTIMTLERPTTSLPSLQQGAETLSLQETQLSAPESSVPGSTLLHSAVEIVAEVHPQPSTQSQGPLCFRQGDVLFTRIAVLPSEALAVRESDVIVASTHTHRLREGRILEDATGTLFLDVPEPTQVTHEEHRPVSLPAGVFQVTRQRQYTPEAIRMVWD